MPTPLAITLQVVSLAGVARLERGCHRIWCLLVTSYPLTSWLVLAALPIAIWAPFLLMFILNAALFVAGFVCWQQSLSVSTHQSDRSV